LILLPTATNVLTAVRRTGFAADCQPMRFSLRILKRAKLTMHELATSVRQTVLPFRKIWASALDELPGPSGSPDQETVSRTTEAVTDGLARGDMTAF